MTSVPVSIPAQQYPYLEFLPRYDTRTVERTTRNLLDLYRQTEADLRRQWAAIVDNPRATNTQARLTMLLRSLDRSKRNVDETVAEWVRTTYPGQYATGAVRMAEGYDSSSFVWSQPHRDAVALLANDTFTSLLHSTTFEPESIKATVRELARTATAQKLLGGETAYQAGAKLAGRLAEQGIFGVTYADGRFVKASSYAEMVVRSRSAIAYNAGGLNQARSDGVEFFEISDGLDCGLEEHDSKPAASGMIVTGDVAAMFPISHPNCVRSFLPRPDLATEDLTKIENGEDLSLVDPRSRADQAAFDQYAIEQQDKLGLTRRQAAAKFGRAERAGRAPRATAGPRAPRTPRATRAPKPQPTSPAAPPARATPVPAPPAPVAPRLTPSGVPVDRPIAGKTAEQIETSFREKWGTRADGSTRRVDLKKFGTNGARAMADTLDRQFARMPVVAERVQYAGDIPEMLRQIFPNRSRQKRMTSAGLASTDGRMGFQQSFLRKDLAQAGALNKNAEFWSTARPEHVFAHEFGHEVGYVAEMREMGIPLTEQSPQLGARVGSVERLSSTLRAAMQRDLGITEDPFARSYVSAELSKYGATNLRETIAESWAEYTLEGNNARRFARALGQILERLATGGTA